jgi:hypothetical protein
VLNHYGTRKMSRRPVETGPSPARHAGHRHALKTGTTQRHRKENHPSEPKPVKPESLGGSVGQGFEFPAYPVDAVGMGVPLLVIVMVSLLRWRTPVIPLSESKDRSPVCAEVSAEAPRGALEIRTVPEPATVTEFSDCPPACVCRRIMKSPFDESARDAPASTVIEVFPSPVPHVLLRTTMLSRGWVSLPEEIAAGYWGPAPVLSTLMGLGGPEDRKGVGTGLADVDPVGADGAGVDDDDCTAPAVCPAETDPQPVTPAAMATATRTAGFAVNFIL